MVICLKQKSESEFTEFHVEDFSKKLFSYVLLPTQHPAYSGLWQLFLPYMFFQSLWISGGSIQLSCSVGLGWFWVWSGLSLSSCHPRHRRSLVNIFKTFYWHTIYILYDLVAFITPTELYSHHHSLFRRDFHHPRVKPTSLSSPFSKRSLLVTFLLMTKYLTEAIQDRALLFKVGIQSVVVRKGRQ